jgi:hypothetical protein
MPRSLYDALVPSQGFIFSRLLTCFTTAFVLLSQLNIILLERHVSGRIAPF